MRTRVATIISNYDYADADDNIDCDHGYEYGEETNSTNNIDDDYHAEDQSE